MTHTGNGSISLKVLIPFYIKNATQQQKVRSYRTWGDHIQRPVPSEDFNPQTHALALARKNKVKLSLPLLVPILSPTFVWHSSHLSFDAWWHFVSNLTTVQSFRILALTLRYPGRPCLFFKAFFFRCKRISRSGPTWMHPSAWNFTAGSIGCVYQVSCHEMTMSLSFKVVLMEVKWDFSQIFQQKSAQLGTKG